jgi:hypothetical protein
MLTLLNYIIIYNLLEEAEMGNTIVGCMEAEDRDAFLEEWHTYSDIEKMELLWELKHTNIKHFKFVRLAICTDYA